jgi:hypothetical protein
MRRAALLGGLLVSFLSAPALAHPHVLISQVVRFVESGGVFTHVEVEWRFDPMASELEIAAADDDRDGQLSSKEVKALAELALSELKELGYLTWINTGEKDFRPKAPVFNARIANPAIFMPADWAPTADMPGGPAASPGAGAKGATPKDKQGKTRQGPRNLVYTLRFALPQPAKTAAVSSIDPEDFVRIELDRKAPWEIIGGSATCAVDKNNAVKSEYWPGNPFFADRVTCKLP